MNKHNIELENPSKLNEVVSQIYSAHPCQKKYSISVSTQTDDFDHSHLNTLKSLVSQQKSMNAEFLELKEKFDSGDDSVSQTRSIIRVARELESQIEKAQGFNQEM